MTYVELHCHSAFSFLDGASLPDELAAAAAHLGYEALALTDHDSVSGSMELAQAAPGLGLRAIHGAEISLADGRHLTLLVQDATGWANLCRILTRAHAHVRDTVPPPPPAVDLDTVLAHAEGLVCLSGCASRGIHEIGSLRRLLEAFGPERLWVELQRPFQRHDRARNRALAALARRLNLACVATGNVHAHTRSRAPLQDAFTALRHHATLDASEPLRRGNWSHVLASPAAMAARFEDHPEAVRETAAVAERLQFDLTADLGYRYPGAEDAAAPRRLAELCRIAFDERYPRGNGLRREALGRLEEELRVIDALGLAGFFLLHRDLLELAREVAVEVRGPSTARALLPPGRGRGSSVSSIVCYLTGLSHIDPVANELFLGRFLNEELTSLPDIDLDFPRDIRAELIPRVHDRFGRDHSALVAAFPTFKARGAIRELGKVLGLPAGEIERVARGAEPWGQHGVERDILAALGAAVQDPDAPELAGVPGQTAAAPAPAAAGSGAVGAAAAAFGSGAAGMPAGGGSGLAFAVHDMFGPFMATPPGERRSRDGDPHDPPLPAAAPKDGPRMPLRGRWAWLAQLCDEAYGLPRHLSQHSGGMIVSTRPLIDCCPVLPAAMEGRLLCQWDKDSCADAGFLKIDLLGLGMLSAVERCVESIAHARCEQIDLSRIPFDDPETFAAIQDADTMGVFQIESRAQMASLRRTRPQTLADLTIQVAIVRPGPILGGAVNPYIARRQQLREDPTFVVPYEHPSLEPVLRDTLGTIIFQDQVLEVAMAFAGFSPGEAEGLRRAMSRKRSAAAIEAYHARFVDGARRTHGADEALAERVWGMIEGFSGFGFPKAHGAAFGLLAYQSTWLRTHYAPEFLCALLNEQPMGFYPSDTLIHEAQRRGLEVLPADVNESAVECSVDGAGRVRVGLGYVSGVRADEVAALVRAREEGGPFRSLADLASRAGAGRPSLEQLAWSGACDGIATPAEGDVAPGAPSSVASAGDVAPAEPAMSTAPRRQEAQLRVVDGEGADERAGPRLDRARRAALWQLGVAAPGARLAEGTQLTLPLDVPAPPPLRALDGWEAMVADYATTGLTLGPHPIALLRPSLPRGTVSVLDLERLRHEAPVRIAGLVVARQRPGTAKGIVFLLLEDEFGTINLVVPPDVYERHRLIVRSEPLILAEGRLEKLPIAGGAINVFVRSLRALDAPAPDAADVVELAVRAERSSHGVAAEAAAAAAAAGPARATTGSARAAASDGRGADFRPVAPPIQSFAAGRRR
jgi:error-prone DNA polymerase